MRLFAHICAMAFATAIAQAQTNPLAGSTNLAEQLYKLQMERIRSGEKPQPIQLTPEMDAQLVRQGILPAKDDSSPPGNSVAPSYEKLCVFNFSNSPLPQVLDFYSDLTGKQISIDDGVTASITAISTSRLTVAETLHSIEEMLLEQGIKLTPSGTNSIRVHKLSGRGDR